MKNAYRKALQWSAGLLPLGLMLTAAAQFPRTTTEPAAVDRGAKIWAKDCARCHGADAKGTDTAPDLYRSTMVLHDRRENLRGKELAPFLKTSAPHHFSYSDKEASDISQFLSAQIAKILRSGYNDKPQGLTSGDLEAGKAYFNGAGGCTKCHSVTGDLAGIGKRYTTATLQQKIVFPQGGLGKKAPVEVTVKMPTGKTVSGTLVSMDDFTATVKHQDGNIESVNIVAGSKVSVKNPYAEHEALVHRLTDADMHNLTTYLDTLQ